MLKVRQVLKRQFQFVLPNVGRKKLVWKAIQSCPTGQGAGDGGLGWSK